MKKKLDVYIIAHEFNPVKGSEAMFAWEILKRLSCHVNLNIIYSYANQSKTLIYNDEVLKHKNEFDANTIFIPIKYTGVAKSITRINFALFKKSNVGFKPLYFLALKFWNKNVELYLERNMNRSDVLHLFNHISFREPLSPKKLMFKKLVWGPVSGTMNIPLPYFRKFRFFTVIEQFLRFLSQSVSYFFNNNIRNLLNVASKVFVVTAEDFTFFSQRNNNVTYLPDVGFTSIDSNIKSFNFDKEVKFVSIGRLDDLKATYIAIEAFLKYKESTDLNCTLDVFGDGVNFESLINIYKSEAISFNGFIDNEQLLTNLRNFDVLLFPSVKEATSLTVIECLSHGLYVCAHDSFGIKAISSPLLFKSELINPELSISSFVENITEIVSQKQTDSNDSNNLANYFTYDNIVKKILTSYE
jgi:glycosyltransferase involved in cell wall biosynthesis